MRTRSPLALPFLAALPLLLVPGAASAQVGRPPAAVAPAASRLVPGVPVALRGSGVSAPTVVRPVRRASLRASGSAPTGATFQVTYTGFSAVQRDAFQAAVDTWARLLSSSVPIRIDARLSALEPGVLGSAGAANYYIDDRNGGYDAEDTLVPIALANARRGVDLDPAGPDILADFSNDASLFSYGATPAPGTYDFTTVVLHEIGHGLGFAGDMEVRRDTAGVDRGYWDPDKTRPRPFPFDRYTVTPRTDGGTTPLLSLLRGSSALAAALTTGRAQWDGPSGRAANGGVRPELFTPSTWQQGSSYSHLDEATYPAGNADSLMTPELSLGEVIRDPGAITLGILDDEGWGSSTTAAASPTPTATASPSATATASPGATASPTATASPGAASPAAPRLTGPSNVAAGRTVAVTGVAPADRGVQIYVKRRGSTTTSPGAEAGYVLARELTSASNGSFSTTFVADDDQRYYAKVGDAVSNGVLTQVRPSFAGALTRVVRRGTTVTLSGRGLPGTRLALRFSHGSSSDVRAVAVGSAGTWSRAQVLTRDLRVSARGANGLASDPNVLLQAR